MSSELDRVALLARLFGASSRADSSIIRGIGDDAAILDAAARARQGLGEQKLVWTIDAHVEGVHFRANLASWYDVGWRSFMAAASDLAAMGATPWCALSALVLPGAMDDAAFRALAEGQAEAAQTVGAAVAGGNLSRGGEASITTTLLGVAARPVERKARAGDGIWISGEVGLAAAGLRALELGLNPAEADVAPAVAAWRRPVARIAAGLAMAPFATGAIDVSDGLARDVAHLARAGGLRAVFFQRELGAHFGASFRALASRLGVSALDLALYGGEDYALVSASADPLEGFVKIGRFESADGGGDVAIDEGTTIRPLDTRGFDHFD